MLTTVANPRHRRFQTHCDFIICLYRTVNNVADPACYVLSSSTDPINSYFYDQIMTKPLIFTSSAFPLTCFVPVPLYYTTSDADVKMWYNISRI
jgi:hypothetical protein